MQGYTDITMTIVRARQAALAAEAEAERLLRSARRDRPGRARGILFGWLRPSLGHLEARVDGTGEPLAHVAVAERASDCDCEAQPPLGRVA